MKIEFISVNKNDDYHSNHMQRLNFAINHNLNEIKKTKYKSKIKFTLIDWCSTTKLSESLTLNDNYTNFNIIYINKNDIKSNNDSSIINIPLALNFAIRNSNADYILIGSFDQINNSENWEKIYKSCQKEVKYNRLMHLKRRFIPNDFFTKSLDYNFLNFTLKQNNFKFGLIDKSGGGAAAIGASVKFWRTINGLNESILGWGASDLELYIYALNFNLPVNGTDIYGTFLYKLPYATDGLRNKMIKFNTDLFTKFFFVRKKNWGLNINKLIYENPIVQKSLINSFITKKNESGILNYLFSIAPFLSYKDNIFFLYKLKKNINASLCSNFLLSKNLTIAEIFTFLYSNRVSNIFLKETNNKKIRFIYRYYDKLFLIINKNDPFVGNIIPLSLSKKNLNKSNFNYLKNGQLLYFKANTKNEYSLFIKNLSYPSKVLYDNNKSNKLNINEKKLFLFKNFSFISFIIFLLSKIFIILFLNLFSLIYKKRYD